MGSRIDGPFNYSVDEIQCPRCGKTGSIVWETIHTARGQDRQFLEIKGDFSEIVSRKAPHMIEIICHACGGRQPEPKRPDVAARPNPPSEDERF